MLMLGQVDRGHSVHLAAGTGNKIFARRLTLKQIIGRIQEIPKPCIDYTKQA